MIIGKEPIAFQIDTGASVNLLPARYAPYIEPTSKKLTMWNGSVLRPLGQCRTILRNPKNSKKYNVEFVVVEGDRTPLIGHSAAEQMKLIEVREENLKRVLHVKVSDSIIANFEDVFDGKLGNIPGTVTLRTNPDSVPVIMPASRTPVAIRPKLKVELDEMVTQGIIAPVNELTPWVSQLVITQKKDGNLRLCIHPMHLNKALQRELFTLPILEDVLHELGQSRIFSKADLASGFWHIQLDEPSSLLTTFQTCFGRYRWLRLPFGTSVSSEIFAKKLLEALDGLPGVICIADDIVIHAKTEQEHDSYLEQFLTRCRETGIKLNKGKFELRMKEISFMGHRITSSGLEADPLKRLRSQRWRPHRIQNSSVDFWEWRITWENFFLDYQQYLSHSETS